MPAGVPLTEEYVLAGTTYQVFERGQLAWDGKTVRNAAGDGQFIRPHKAGELS